MSSSLLCCSKQHTIIPKCQYLTKDMNIINNCIYLVNEVFNFISNVSNFRVKMDVNML